MNKIAQDGKAGDTVLQARDRAIALKAAAESQAFQDKRQQALKFIKRQPGITERRLAALLGWNWKDERNRRGQETNRDILRRLIADLADEIEIRDDPYGKGLIYPKGFRRVEDVSSGFGESPCSVFRVPIAEVEAYQFSAPRSVKRVTHGSEAKVFVPIEEQIEQEAQRAVLREASHDQSAESLAG